MFVKLDNSDQSHQSDYSDNSTGFCADASSTAGSCQTCCLLCVGCTEVISLGYTFPKPAYVSNHRQRRDHVKPKIEWVKIAFNRYRLNWNFYCKWRHTNRGQYVKRFITFFHEKGLAAVIGKQSVQGNKSHVNLYCLKIQELSSRFLKGLVVLLTENFVVKRL